jgi:DNA-binding NtrC family response regulator
VGETKPRSSDFRLISATNRPLREMISTGAFREDLFYRLNAGTIETKPLTEHREDIPALVRHFALEFGKRQRRHFSIKPEALQLIEEQAWPGNIRELRNAVTMLCTTAMKSRVVTYDTVVQTFPCPLKSSARPMSFALRKNDFEKDYYERLIVKHGGNISRASAEAGLLRPNLSKKLKELGIRAADYKSRGRR